MMKHLCVFVLLSVFLLSCGLKKRETDNGPPPLPDEEQQAESPSPEPAEQKDKAPIPQKAEQNDKVPTPETVEKKDKVPTPKTAEQKGVFEAGLHPGEEASQYSVVLRWQYDVDTKYWIIYRREKDGVPTELVRTSNNSFIDNSVGCGVTYLYQLDYESSGGYSTLAEVEIKIPTDIKIQGHRVLRGEIKAGRLFFEKNAVIITNGDDLEIKATEVISDGAVINLSPPKRQILHGNNGFSAGLFAIETTRASGHLHIIGHGEDGGPGFQGSCGKDGQKGGDGGNSAWIFIDILERSHFKVTVDAMPGTGGSGGKPGPPDENGKIGKGGSPGKDGQKEEVHIYNGD